MIHVQVCAAQPLALAGLRNILLGAADIRIVDEPGDISDVLLKGRPSGADVAIVQAGPKVLKHLRSASAVNSVAATYPVVVVTGALFEHAVLDAISGGIRGFVSDQAVHEELVPAVRSLAEGRAFLSPRITNGLLDWLAGQLPADPTRFSRADQVLTEREREVLIQLGLGHSNAQIAERFVISQTTVRSHTYHILTKLGLPNRTQAVLFGYQYQLISRVA
ncbi:DNA-binding response regulator [Amycolatopsis sp. cmx-11-12]|uniref:response regulator transcription factor n=1 Tax=Amycolatopsis sp. cmx-11-12 TaxID=2785795 RepID=UPI003916DB4E